MNYEDEINSMELDMDLEPACFKRMNRIVLGICLVPYALYELCCFGALTLATKMHQ